MSSAAERRLASVWLLLAAITVVQLGLDSIDGQGPLQPNGWITSAIIVIALLKVRLILLEFMELRQAPARLVRLAEFWVVLTGATLLGIYFLGRALWAG